jgi:hypothetical protein
VLVVGGEVLCVLVCVWLCVVGWCVEGVVC